MTADAAHVAAVAEAMGDVWATRTNDEDGSTSIYARTVDDLATVAVETLTPLIRAQERAQVRADIEVKAAAAAGVFVNAEAEMASQAAFSTAARIAKGTP